MTDIVERLRARAVNIDNLMAEISGTDGSPYDVFRKELREAADMIERLQTESAANLHGWRRAIERFEHELREMSRNRQGSGVAGAHTT